MSEDETKVLTDRQLLELILARLAKVEAFVEDRSRDNRPMLELIHKELADTRLEFREHLDKVEGRLKRIEAKLDVLTLDVMDVRAAQKEVERRVTDLERPRS